MTLLQYQLSVQYIKKIKDFASHRGKGPILQSSMHLNDMLNEMKLESTSKQSKISDFFTKNKVTVGKLLSKDVINNTTDYFKLCLFILKCMYCILYATNKQVH